MKVIKLDINDNDLDGIDFMSLVGAPAIEEGFFSFNEQTEEQIIDEDYILELLIMDMLGISDNFEFSLNEDKQILIGPAMIPNKLILRVDSNKEPYYVFFDEESIKKIAYKMAKDKLLDSVNVEHNEVVEDIFLIESWIIEDEESDKSKKYGFNLPVGTWMTMYKIDNDEVWKKVKDGTYKGFSVEGFFSNKTII